MRRFLSLLAPLIAVSSTRAQAPLASPLPAEYQRLARDVLTEAVNTNTTASVGSTSALARKLQARLLAAGYATGDVHIVGSDPKNQNLIVRLRGRPSVKKPILLAAHLDVVEATKADWTADPFTLRLENGFFLGRGAEDDKSGVTVLITNLIRWKREKWTPDRDVIAFFSADEESDATKGVQWVLAHARNLIDAEFCLNTDGGGVELANGKPRAFGVEASEKVYVTFRLAATNPGGHSSRPRPDNAIYQLAHALARLESYTFPVKLNEVSRTQLERSAALQSPDTAADMRLIAKGYANSSPDAEAQAAMARLSREPSFNALFRTTCVATMLDGGHAENALPQRARATVNCRMLPNDSPAEVEQTIKRIAGDSVAVTVVYAPVPSEPSPLRADLMSLLDQLSVRYFPGAPVIPAMALGASDGLYLRNAGIPTYSLSAIAEVDGESNAHGLNEKVRERSIYGAVAFWNDMVRGLAVTH
ncbi:MAG TPA: M20/M25/M40 family metallo-hydrolase [Gemmatimonadaceae bacterium]|jgi:acetylornithine deacetylase/succinyl-diaminopimelate desuccinylase-like protein